MTRTFLNPMPLLRWLDRVDEAIWAWIVDHRSLIGGGALVALFGAGIIGVLMLGVAADRREFEQFEAGCEELGGAVITLNRPACYRDGELVVEFTR